MTKKLKITTIRFFNTAGPRQTGKYGMVIQSFDNAFAVFADSPHTQTRLFKFNPLLSLAKFNTNTVFSN